VASPIPSRHFPDRALVDSNPTPSSTRRDGRTTIGPLPLFPNWLGEMPRRAFLRAKTGFSAPPGPRFRPLRATPQSEKAAAAATAFRLSHPPLCECPLSYPPATVRTPAECMHLPLDRCRFGSVDRRHEDRVELRAEEQRRVAVSDLGTEVDDHRPAHPAAAAGESSPDRPGASEGVLAPAVRVSHCLASQQ
jgi:hypothetical protein